MKAYVFFSVTRKGKKMKNQLSTRDKAVLSRQKGDCFGASSVIEFHIVQPLEMYDWTCFITYLESTSTEY